VGLPAASLVILRFALFAPRLVGVNVTLIVQPPPTATAVQLLDCANWLAFVPLIVTPLTTSGAPPVLLSVTTWTALVTPKSWFAKLSDVGVTAALGAVPTPERGTEADTAIVLLL
jgi:hypothetical protein